jgi:hypothetical protein
MAIMRRQPEQRRKLHSKRIGKSAQRRRRARVLGFEAMESRFLLAGFLQGYAFVDGNGNNQLDPGETRKGNATIQLRSADGGVLLNSTTTNSDGYYRFDNLASGTYRLREVAPGFVTQGVQIQNKLSAAVATGVGNTEIQVTLTDPLSSAWVDANPSSPPNPNPLMVHLTSNLPGVNSAYTLTGTVPAAPFNGVTSNANTQNARQFQIMLTGGALPGATAPFYSFCIDLFHANPINYSVVPSLAPPPPGLATNIGRIGYLYNEFGTNLLSPTQGTGLQLALYELIYDATPNLASGNLVVNQATTNPTAYAAAVNYLAASAGKDQRAYFLNVSPPTPTGDQGRQGMLVTESFNFANRPAHAQASAKIQITPNDTNEVGQNHTFTTLVMVDDGLIAGQGGDGVTGFRNATDAEVQSITVTLAGQNGANPVIGNPVDPENDDVVGSGNNNFAVAFTSAAAGLVHGSATATVVVNGQQLVVQTNGLAGNSSAATKRFVDARITITPNATNPVGAPHTFTVAVQQDDGFSAAQGGDGVSGFAPVSGASVSVHLDGTGGAVPDVSAPSNLPAADPTVVVGNTNAAGQFSVTFTSATAGDVVGNASVALTVGGVALTRDTNPATANIGAGPGGSGPATKKFVRAGIDGIDIEKTTNGPTNSNPIAPDFDNEDSATGPGVPRLTPGSAVTWTYKVTNTGSVSYAFNAVVIVDDNGTPATSGDDLSTTNGKITFQSVQTGDADNVLEPGEVWLYKATGIVKDLGAPAVSGPPVTFNFEGNSSLDGPEGNIRTFTAGGVSVKASAFSRHKTSGAWSAAYLGAYDGGLGVTDNNEGNGSNNRHAVDNIDRDNHVLFEFSETVVVDAAFLGFVVKDSDLRIWIGNIPNAFNNHQTLSDALLSGLGFTELNETTLATTRLADLNAGGVAGNVLVIGANISEPSPNDRFKIETLKVAPPKPQPHACYENKAVVTVPGGATDFDFSHYCNPASTPPANPVKFLVVDDDLTDKSEKTFRYDASGTPANTSTLQAENSKPRGIASNAAGTRNWIIDANDKVYVYDGAGVLLGSWIAFGLDKPEDITTNGTDVWIVDEGTNKVVRYAGAASRTSGSQQPTDSFKLHASNSTATGIVTDGNHFWVVNYGNPDKVFKYTMNGSLTGSWTIDARNSHPTGITIDPTNVKHIWIVDLGDRKVYEYRDAVGRTGGSQNAASSFDLKNDNTDPQGIADPKPGGESAELTDEPLSPANDLALADWVADRRWSGERRKASSTFRTADRLVPTNRVASDSLIALVSATRSIEREQADDDVERTTDAAFDRIESAAIVTLEGLSPSASW